MDHISGFFSRYLSPYFRKERMKESAAKICSEVLGVEVLPAHITIRSGVCAVAGSQALKHQIFLRQEDILRRFKENKDLSLISGFR
jgi:hypothetical protein